MNGGGNGGENGGVGGEGGGEGGRLRRHGGFGLLPFAVGEERRNERERKKDGCIYKGVVYYKFSISLKEINETCVSFQNGLRLNKLRLASGNCPDAGMKLASREKRECCV